MAPRRGAKLFLSGLTSARSSSEPSVALTRLPNRSDRNWPSDYRLLRWGHEVVAETKGHGQLVGRFPVVLGEERRRPQPLVDDMHIGERRGLRIAEQKSANALPVNCPLNDRLPRSAPRRRFPFLRGNNTSAPT